MKLTADYHTHTTYSDGKNTVFENAQRAKEIGLKEIAITEHGFAHLAQGIRRRELPQFLADIRAARAKAGIPVLVGMEANICGMNGECDLTEQDYDDFEIFLCGFHACSHHADFHAFWNGWRSLVRYVIFKKETASARIIRETTRAYCNVVMRNPIDVLTHINYQCYADAVEVAKCCRDYGTYVEISGKKPHLSDEDLQKVADTGVRFVVNSDAHSIDRIGDIALALRQIERVGISFERIDNLNGKLPSFRFAAYKLHR